MLPYHSGVLDDAPTGPGMILMPGGSAAPADGRARGSRRLPGHHRGRSGGHGFRCRHRRRRGVVQDAPTPGWPGWVRRLVDDDDTAHEIAAEAFARLLARWTRVDNPQSYLYMIATNLIRDHWRKAERERRALRSVTAGADLDAVAYPAQDVDVRNLISRCPPGCATRSCCTTTPASRSGTSRRCCTGPRARSRPTCSRRGPSCRPRWGNAMADRRDDLDSWLDGRIEPLPPPPGTFELIKKRARRRKYPPAGRPARARRRSSWPPRSPSRRWSTCRC